MIKGNCCFCAQAVGLVANPQPPSKEDTVAGRATPEEQYVTDQHTFAGVACDGSGLIPMSLAGDMDPNPEKTNKVANPA